ncbi:MAG: MmcQ/YjbR family DNA-binding protein [Gemmatimonadales bacterium]
MTVTEFRRFALSLPAATASAHMGHPDFRVGGKIFATLAYPSREWGVVMLTPDEQEFFLNAKPRAFTPAPEHVMRTFATAA